MMKQWDEGIFSEFSVRGQWWLSEKPNERVTGTLHYSPDRIKLQLDRSFLLPELMGAFAVGGFRTPSIHGETNGGERCSLLDAFFVSSQASEVILYANSVLLGTWVESSKTLSATKSIVRFSNLEDWAGHYLIREESGLENTKFIVPNTPYTAFQLHKLPLIGSLFLVTSIQTSSTQLQTVLKHTTHFLIEFDVPSNMENIVHAIRSLGNLLSLLVGDAVLPTSVRVISSASEFGPEISARCLFPLRRSQPKQKSRYEMPFPLRDFPDGTVEVFFKSWFEEEAILRPVCDLLLSTIYDPGQYVQTIFLALAQGLESFHRRLHQGHYMDKGDYSKIRTALVKAMPEDTPSALRDKLTGVLSFGNELSLRSRLESLFSEIETDHFQKMSASETPVKFAKFITDIRNYLTHYDETQKPAILGDNSKMYNLNRRLAGILTLLLMKHLGLKENQLFLPIHSHLHLAQ